METKPVVWGLLPDMFSDLGYAWAYRALDSTLPKRANCTRRVFVTMGAESCDWDPKPVSERRFTLPVPVLSCVFAVWFRSILDRSQAPELNPYRNPDPSDLCPSRRPNFTPILIVTPPTFATEGGFLHGAGPSPQQATMPFS